MEYVSDILAFVAIIVSVIASISANKLAHKQIELSVDQSEVGNQLALIDKRIELYLFLRSVQEKLDHLYGRAFDEQGNRKKGINAAHYVMYYIFGLDLFMDLDVEYKNLSDHDTADLLAALSRLDRYAYYSEVFWKKDEAVEFMKEYKEFNKKVIYASANDSDKAEHYAYAAKGDCKDARVAVLDQIVEDIRTLKQEMDRLPLGDLKKLPGKEK